MPVELVLLRAWTPLMHAKQHRIILATLAMMMSANLAKLANSTGMPSQEADRTLTENWPLGSQGGKATVYQHS